MKTTLKTGEKKLDKMSNFVMSNAGTMLDNKYEIKREIARGGMGIVYEAYHKYTHQRVAIKVILAEQITPKATQRFQKELEAYSLLSHPNVITIHDAGVYNNYQYIVMEYIEGVDICTYVKQQEEKNRQEDSENANKEQQGRDWQLCTRLIYETALGLDYIHSKKMIHRDIKPANILVRPNGSPVIIDLGIVKFNRTQSYNLTKSRETIGTFEYMPIEQAKGKGGKIDERADIYSLGLVLYELLTGQRAYNGENIMELCYKIMLYYPPLPREIDAQIPEVLEEITIHATDKQKEKRYASMKEFADALKWYLDDTTVKPTPQYSNIKHRLWFEKNKNKIVTSCISVLLAIGLVILLSMVDKKEEPRVKKQETTNTQKHEISQNDAAKQYQLGLMYEEGMGVPKDLKKAIYCYEKAAIQGLAQAQYSLGVKYETGKGVKQDVAKAVYYYEKSANQGYANAQFSLGCMYRSGKGVKQDVAKAIYYYEKSANQGNFKAQYNLGFIYYEGQGVKQDVGKAVYWYEKAAIQGSEYAQYNLGFIYYEGQGIKQDIAKARYWFEKAAIQGSEYAQYNLGVIYYEGQGVKQDIAKARYWFEKAAIQGDTKSQQVLKLMPRN